MSWIIDRMKQIAEEAKSWPKWVREQPLTRADIKFCSCCGMQGLHDTYECLCERCDP